MESKLAFGKRTTGNPCFIGDSVHCDFCGEEFDVGDDYAGIQIRPDPREFDSLSLFSGGLDLCFDCGLYVHRSTAEWLERIENQSDNSSGNTEPSG